MFNANVYAVNGVLCDARELVILYVAKYAFII